MRKSRVLLIAFMAVVASLLWLALRSTADGDGAADNVATQTAENGRDGRPGFHGSDKPGGSGLPVWKQPTASVSGRVHDEDGRPIAGARVCAFTDTKELALARRRNVPCAKTRNDGVYRIEGLHPVSYSLSASAAEHIPARWHDGEVRTLWLSAGRERKGLDIELESGGVQIFGVVSDIAGGVIEGALVQSSSGFFGSVNSDAAAVTHSDEEGRFSLWVRPGSASLNARAEGYADGTEHGATPGHFFEVRLSPESVLVGRVVSADTGKPVEGARVTATRGLYGRADATLTEADGRFRIDGLEPGSFSVTAQSETGYGRSAAQLHLGLGEHSEGVVVRLHPAGSVLATVAVSGQHETRCKRGGVTLESKELDQRRYESTKREGVAEVLGLVPGTYKVTVWCDGYRPREDYDDLTIEAGELVEVTLEVEEARAIRGRVISADGEPAVNIWVRATPKAIQGRAQRTSKSASTDTDGSFELAGLLPGEYDVQAAARDDARASKVTVTVTETSDAQLVIELPRGSIVSGIVVDETGAPVGNVRVQDRGPTQNWGAKTSDDEGHFTFEGLPPGEHRFFATDGRLESMRAPGTGDDDVQGVTIALGEDEQREVTIIVESQGGQIRGRVVEDAGGPVSDAFIQVTRESDSAAAGKGHNRAKARWGGWMDTPVMTDEEGRFTMTKLAEGARYTVFAHRKGGGEGIAEHVEVGSSGVEVVIAPTGSISGKVTLADGTAPIEVSVKVHDALTGVQRADKFYRTDGVFVFENLPAGKYELVASTTKGDATTEVELAKGATQDGIDLQLTSRVTVKGRVVDAETNEPISGMVVRIQKDGGSFIWTSGGDHGEDAKYVTDASGRFEVENAPAGEVKMWVMSRTRGAGDYNPLWANERIPDDEDPFEMPTIELIKKRLDDEEQPGDLGFKLREGDAGQDRNEGDLIIAFIRPGGPADKAGLSVGDKITTVDGHDVTGEHKSRYWALTRVKEGTALDIGLDSGTSVELVAAKPL